MELLADQDPEEARRLLDPVLERMMEAVHRYEGTVNQVMGDGIMALFGAPLAHEDHAVRACHAALRMQQTVGWYAEELRRGRGVDVQIRIGLNSGEVVVRAIDSDLHMDYSAIGQTTHLAARMEQLARPGSTLISRETLRLAEGYVEIKALGPVPVKGMPEPVEIFELVRSEQVHSRLEASAARGLTPVRGPRGRGGRAPPGDGARGGRPRPGGGGVGRAGGGQVASVLGVHPLPSRARLAHDGGAGHLLRQEHLVPDGQGAPPELLPPGGARRRPAGARESHRQAPHARREPAADPARVPPAPRRAGGRRGVADPGPAAAPAAHARRGQAAHSPGRPGAAGAPGVREPPLAGFGEPGLPRQPRGQPAAGPRARARELPARVPARVGAQELLHPVPDRSAPAPELGGAAARADGRRPRPGPAQAAPDRADRGQPVLHRGERAHPGRDQGARGHARALPPDPRGAEGPGAGHRAGGARRAHRSPPHREQAAAPGRRGHRQGRVDGAAAGDRRPLRGDGAPQPDPAPVRRVPVRDQPVPERGVHLPPRADPRGGLLEPAAGSPARPARSRGAGDGAALRGPAARALRAPRPPRGARRGVDEGGGLPPPGGDQGGGALRQSRGGHLLRAGDGARSGGCPRAGPPPSRRSTCASICARRSCSWASSSAC